MNRAAWVILMAMTCACVPSASGQEIPSGDRGTSARTSSQETPPFEYPVPPKPNDENFIVDDAPGMLDTSCRYRDEGDIVVDLPIGRVVGDVARLKANGMIDDSLTLEIPAWDVDYYPGACCSTPERDEVWFNDHLVPGSYLQGYPYSGSQPATPTERCDHTLNSAWRLPWQW